MLVLLHRSEPSAFSHQPSGKPITHGRSCLRSAIAKAKTSRSKRIFVFLTADGFLLLSSTLPCTRYFSASCWAPLPLPQMCLAAPSSSREIGTVLTLSTLWPLGLDSCWPPLSLKSFPPASIYAKK